MQKQLDKLQARFDALEVRHHKTRQVLYDLIAWMAASAASPVSIAEARLLLEALDRE